MGGFQGPLSELTQALATLTQVGVGEGDAHESVDMNASGDFAQPIADLQEAIAMLSPQGQRCLDFRDSDAAPAQIAGDDVAAPLHAPDPQAEALLRAPALSWPLSTAIPLSPVHLLVRSKYQSIGTA